MSDLPFSQPYLDKAEQVFLQPSPLYPYRSIISGVQVQSQHGSTRPMWAVAQNTFRGFHRVNKACPGAKEGFVSFFLDNEQQIIGALRGITESSDLDMFAKGLCKQLLPALSNCKPEQLASYNKVRKPVDLYLQHVACMAAELNDSRTGLVPLLRLPLDSQMFAHPHVFSIDVLASNGLSRRSTYQAVRSADTYNRLQHALAETANDLTTELGRPFYPIYFDLLWNNRYERWGGNLFETSP